MVENKEFENIRIRSKDKRRLDSILRKGESYDLGVEILLFIYSHPKRTTNPIFQHRTVYPSFTEAEEAELYKELKEHMPISPLKTPKQIQKEMEE